jgi:hypothetical protein
MAELPSNTIMRIQAKVLSFSSCKLVQNPSGTVHVSFGTIKAIPSLSASCVNSILRVMDGPVTLDLIPSAMGVSLPSETSSSTRVGGVFADIVLTVINTLDISSMPYTMARTWLEILIIFILKVRAPLLHRYAYLSTTLSVVRYRKHCTASSCRPPCRCC